MTRFAKFAATVLVLATGLACSISAASAADYRNYSQGPVIVGPGDHGHIPFWFFLRQRHDDRHQFDRRPDRPQFFYVYPVQPPYALYGDFRRQDR